jgi:hypothetical protein
MQILALLIKFNGAIEVNRAVSTKFLGAAVQPECSVRRDRQCQGAIAIFLCLVDRAC